MSSYIYSKWHNSPEDSPVEFYSELNGERFETRKVEVFKDGSLGFASNKATSKTTKLGIAPVPPLTEIAEQPEFDIRTISPQQFEAKWKEATA
ncbi:DUF6881 domain-containing protein [Microbulbifer spongiae]|uniref:DUF6881 domain-containing protein n=1 Tax=Microbulbifer spongiae TaxID=2944933 RepID=A0ABY9EHT9_9GAMM|nr:hypothetical protein [Microbulbifer sp. MI-G]WKD51140.1 hypothetical protein M8T91_06920 [Microbulbifer sp. MI-G]